MARLVHQNELFCLAVIDPARAIVAGLAELLVYRESHLSVAFERLSNIVVETIYTTSTRNFRLSEPFRPGFRIGHIKSRSRYSKTRRDLLDRRERLIASILTGDR
jgi:hypothetical protein